MKIKVSTGEKPISQYDVYYLFDGENSGDNESVVSGHGKDQHYTKSEGDTLNITMNDSTSKIVWIMSNATTFYQEVNDKFGVHTINLPNGLNIYYSNVGHQSNTPSATLFLKKNRRVWKKNNKKSSI